MPTPTRALVALGLAYITFSAFAAFTNQIAAVVNAVVMFGCVFALTERRTQD